MRIPSYRTLEKCFKGEKIEVLRRNRYSSNSDQLFAGILNQVANTEVPSKQALATKVKKLIVEQYMQPLNFASFSAGANPVDTTNQTQAKFVAEVVRVLWSCAEGRGQA